MAVLPIVLLGVAASLAGAHGQADPTLIYGIDMGNKAYGIVCWYEYLKVFPKTNGNAFLLCSVGLDHIVNKVKDPGPSHKPYFDMYPEKLVSWFGEQTPSQMHQLPSEYNTNCQQYLANSKAAPPTDESDTMNDQGKEYPYKAWVYCMMKTLRDKHGDKAIQAVKDEKTHGKKNWMQALLDRENEFRARHGAEPLTLDKQLTDGAQEWVNGNAQQCKSYHEKQSVLNAVNQGESIFSGGGSDESDVAAYQAVTAWYEEIKNYPFPDAYNGKNAGGDGVVGHFTQTVWKGTKTVGYGYAYNAKCGDYPKYIVARYHPGANLPGAYGENVGLPKD